VSAPADRWGVVPGLPPREAVWAELAIATRQLPAPDGPRPGPPCAPMHYPLRRRNPTKPRPALTVGPRHHEHTAHHGRELIPRPEQTPDALRAALAVVVPGA